MSQKKLVMLFKQSQLRAYSVWIIIPLLYFLIYLDSLLDWENQSHFRIRVRGIEFLCKVIFTAAIVTKYFFWKIIS